MHQGSSIVDDFHTKPPQDLSSFVYQNHDQFKRCMDLFDIKIIMVYDGCRNPLKSTEDGSRSKSVDINVQLTRDVIHKVAGGTTAIAADLMKYKKRAM